MTCLIRHQINSAKGIILILLLLWAFVPNAIGAQGSWHIYVDGSDVTGAAAPLERGDTPAINVMSFSPVLGLYAKVNDETLTIADNSGLEWQAQNGDSSIHTSGRFLALSYPLLIQGASAYLPVDAMAEIAGLILEIDPKLKRATFGRQPVSKPTVPDGWQSLTIEKSPEEKRLQGSNQPQGSSRSNPFNYNIILPRDHDSLRLGLGLGYVTGADYGMELSAYGNVRGAQLNFTTNLTQGNQGLRAYNARLTITDKDMGWGVEAGDIFSDLRGLAQGVRYSWNAGPNRWPSCSLYLNGSSSSSQGIALAYRDEFGRRDSGLFGGEVSTDGSMLLRGAYQKDRLGLYGYYRSVSSESEDKGAGLFFSYNLDRTISLYGGISKSRGDNSKYDWQNLSLRIGFNSGIALSLEHTRSASESSSSTTDAAVLSFPFGPLRILTRYQLRDTAQPPIDPLLEWHGFGNKELMVAVQYAADPRLNFDLQMSKFWRDGSSAQIWQQLVSTYRLTSRTQLQMISAFPQIDQADRLRFRLNQLFGDGYALTAEFGPLTPFQSSRNVKTERGMRFMLRKQWIINTPTRGARIKGRVVDLLGRPFAGAIVRLNGYRVATDDKGWYTCDSLPSGPYHISLDEGSLPADYRVGEGSQKMELAYNTRTQLDFHVVPLNTISGQVFCDTKTKDKSSPAQSMAGLVIRLGDLVTTTNEDGSFGFYNVEPGQHIVKLDKEYLPKQLMAASPTDVTVEVLADKPATGINFRLSLLEKRIVFQEIK